MSVLDRRGLQSWVSGVVIRLGAGRTVLRDGHGRRSRSTLCGITANCPKTFAAAVVPKLRGSWEPSGL